MRTIGACALVLVGLWIGFTGDARAAETASATFIDEITPAGQQDPPLVVFRTKDDPAWQPAAAGMDLADGDYLWVKEGATAVVKVGGTAVMHLEPDTVFTVPEGAAAGGSARVQLEKGSVWASVKELANGQTFTVQTKDAVGGVKGTQFRTAIDPASLETDWDMVEGKLELAPKRGAVRPVMLEAGHNFRLLADGRPQFAAPRRDGTRLRQLQQRFQQRFRRGLPDRASVRQMLRERRANVARPDRRLTPEQRERIQERREERRDRIEEKRDDRRERIQERREERRDDRNDKSDDRRGVVPDRRDTLRDRLGNGANDGNGLRPLGGGGFRGPGGTGGRGLFRGGRSDALDPARPGTRGIVPGATGGNIAASGTSARQADVQTNNRVNLIVTQVPQLERRRELLQREKDVMVTQARAIGVASLRPRVLRMVQEQRDITTRAQRIDQEARTLVNRSQGRGGDLRVRQRLEGVRQRLRTLARPVIPADLEKILLVEEARARPPIDRTPPPVDRTPPPTDDKRPPPDDGKRPPPGDGTRPPGDGTRPPGDGTAPIDGGTDGRRAQNTAAVRLGAPSFGPTGAKPSRPR